MYSLTSLLVGACLLSLFALPTNLSARGSNLRVMQESQSQSFNPAEVMPSYPNPYGQYESTAPFAYQGQWQSEAPPPSQGYYYQSPSQYDNPTGSYGYAEPSYAPPATTSNPKQ